MNLVPYATLQTAPKSTTMTPTVIYFESLVPAFLPFGKTAREALSISTMARTHIETSGSLSCVTLVVLMVLTEAEAGRKVPPCLTKPCLKSRRFCL